MERKLVVRKDDYPQITDWENEGGPAVEWSYKVVGQDEPQLPSDPEKRRVAAARICDV